MEPPRIKFCWILPPRACIPTKCFILVFLDNPLINMNSMAVVVVVFVVAVVVVEIVFIFFKQ